MGASARDWPFTSYAVAVTRTSSPTSNVSTGAATTSRANGAASTRTLASDHESPACARTVTVPADTPTTVPSALMVAMLVSLLLHSTRAPGSVCPFSSDTVARSVSALPEKIVAPGGEMESSREALLRLRAPDALMGVGLTGVLADSAGVRSRRCVISSRAASASAARASPPLPGMLALSTATRSSMDGQRSVTFLASMRMTALARNGGQSGRSSRMGCGVF